MRISIPGHALLVPCEDLQGEWVSWCPELDIMSQGNGAEHGLAMLCEAIKLCIEDDISSGRRVCHPLRRRDPKSVIEDENWVTFQDARHFNGAWENAATVTMDDLRDADGPVLASLSICFETMCGILTEIRMWPHCFRAPGKVYDVLLEKVEPKIRTVDVTLPTWVEPTRQTIEKRIYTDSGEVVREWKRS